MILMSLIVISERINYIIYTMTYNVFIVVIVFILDVVIAVVTIIPGVIPRRSK